MKTYFTKVWRTLLFISLILIIDSQTSKGQVPTNISVNTAQVVNTFPYTDFNVNSSLGGSNVMMQGGCVPNCCSTVVYRIEAPVNGSLRVDASSNLPLAGSILAYLPNVPNPTTANDLTYSPQTGNFCGFRDSLLFRNLAAGDVVYVLAFSHNNQTGNGINTDYIFDFIPDCPPGYVCEYPNVEICDNNGYIDRAGNLLTTSGIYIDTLLGAGSTEDTIVQTNLTVNNTVFTQDVLLNETLCATDTLRDTAYTELVSYADFNRSASNWIEANSIVDDIAGTNRSVFMWMKQSTQVSGSSQMLFSINSSSGGNVCNLQIGTNEQLGVFDGSNARYTGVTVTDGLWHHVGYTYDEATNLTNMYVDGVLSGSYTNGQTIGATNQISLGQEFDSGNSLGNFLNGQMTEVTVWDEVLDSSDIALLIQAPVMTNHSKYTNLKAHYPMMVNCMGNIMEVMDYSGNGNNGLASANSIQSLTVLEQIPNFNAASYYNKEWSTNNTVVSTADTLELSAYTMGNYTLELSRDYFTITDDWTVSMGTGCCVSSSSSISEVVCGSYTAPSGMLYTTSGTYQDTIQNAVSCDSIITINLTVNNSTSSNISEVVCGSYTAPSGMLYTTSGTYQDTIQNAVSCDSIITINLTVNNSTSSNISEVVCGSYTAPSGMLYTASGTYQDTIQNAVSCDSIITINLTVNNSTSSSISEVVCGSYTAPSGMLYTTSGTYQDTIQNAVSCDSIITINLTVNNSTSSSISEVVCGSYTAPSGMLYTTSGTYQDTIQNGVSCDSIITINLTVNNSTSSSISEVVCGSYTAPSGMLYTASGTYQDTIQNAVSCDSIITINLTVNNSTSSNISEVVCGSYTAPSGMLYTASGTYQDTIQNAVSCDSIITINLTVNNSTNSSISEVVCGSYTAPSGMLYTTSGTYQDTIQNGVSCDSIITINLTVNNSTSSSISEVVCGSYTAPSGMLYTASGTYQDTIQNGVSCDSIITINLTVNNSTSSNISEVVCGSYTAPSGMLYTTSGTYQDTIQNGVSCDSIITINLTVNNSTSSSISEVVCGSYTAPSGMLYTTSGTYQDTIQNAVSCDSIITINLTVNNSTSSSISEVVCGSYTAPSGILYTTSGTYQDTIQNGVSCDSIITINLTVNNSTSSSISEVVCGSYTAPSGMLYTTSGTYQDTIQNAVSCDSIITINLTVSTIQLGVSQNGSTLTADEVGAMYQWLDCNNGFAPISGATMQNFDPTANGDYAVEITNSNNCVDTSACTNVTGLSITNNQFMDEVKLYPNPTNGPVQLDLGTIEEEVTVLIHTIEGKLIFDKNFEQTNLIDLNVEGFSGLYLVTLRTASGKTASFKLVKQ